MSQEPIRVLSTIHFDDEQLARLRSVSPRIALQQRPANSEEELVAVLRDSPETVVLYTGRRLPDWSVAPGLEWIQFHFAGIDSVDLSSLPPEVLVTTASGIHSVVMAEHSFALLLALRRQVPLMFDWQRKGQWPAERWPHFEAATLRGQSMGVLGYGSIGREVARLAACFGMTVLAYKRNPDQTADTGYQIPGVGDPEGSIPAEYFGPERLHDFLARSDVVVNLLPAAQATYRLIGKAEFTSMKPSALFLNLGRGTTVDQDALVEALREEHIAGAGLDVFDPEPLPPESPLWQLDSRRLIVSPHVSGASPAYNDEASRLWAENLRRFVAGEPLLNVVSRETGY